LRITKEEIDMGTFYTKCKIENSVDRTKSVIIPKLLVDTGSEYTWIAGASLDKLGVKKEKKDVAFVMANGQHVTRSIGFAIIRLDKFFTIDEVVFAEEGDLLLLGARTLEGLNLAIDPARKKLVAAGPIPAASAQPRQVTTKHKKLLS
jgi:predicted aspartyl protease